MDQRFRKTTCVLITFFLLLWGLAKAFFPVPVQAAEDRTDPTVIQVDLEPGRTDTPIDLFLNAYGGTVLSDDTVIAPGTENTVSVRFTEPNGMPFSYKAYVKTELFEDGKPSDTSLPLVVSVNGGEHMAFSGWFSDGDGILVSSGSLSAGKQAAVDITWKWDFERGDDAREVALSELKNFSATVRVVVVTEAEAPPEETGESTESEAPETESPTNAPTKPSPTDAPSTAAPTKPPSGPRNNTPFGVDDSPLGVIVILSLAAVTGIALILIRRHRKTRNE